MTKKLRVNEQIKAPKIRLIDFDGSQVGVIGTEEALLKAESLGLDLLEVSPDAEIPVCKIIDYGKYKYDLTKKEQKSKKSRSQGDVKGIRLSVKIGRHDFETKARKARGFLEKGNKVSLQLRFKGREIAHKELGEKILRDFALELGEVLIEEEPKIIGRGMTMMVSGKGKN